jgi:hypothetical protein
LKILTSWGLLPVRRLPGKSWKAFAKLIEAERPGPAPSTAPRSSERVVAASEIRSGASIATTPSSPSTT